MFEKAIDGNGMCYAHSRIPLEQMFLIIEKNIRFTLGDNQKEQFKLKSRLWVAYTSSQFDPIIRAYIDEICLMVSVYLGKRKLVVSSK